MGASNNHLFEGAHVGKLFNNSGNVFQSPKIRVFGDADKQFQKTGMHSGCVLQFR